MTPDRWQRVEEVFSQALERDPAARESFVREACGDDTELRDEVDSLIGALECGSRDVLESPAVDASRIARTRASKLAIGRRLGAYEILAPLGSGGMGTVYRARDSRLDREVALKVVVGPEAGFAARSRFEREAKAVAALSHPNILAIFDYGVDEGVSYAATELLEGETLRSRIERGPVPETEALNYAIQIARGLSAAHLKGIIHRDLKPENVFLARDGQLKILDFGLSKHWGAADPPAPPSPLTDSGHTQPGTVMGTVGYMSPEQARGLPVDPRSDIFSLGAILHEILTGQRAFARQTPELTVAAIADGTPKLSPESPGIAPDVAAVVRRCLSKDPDGRYATVHEVKDALVGTLKTREEGGSSARERREKRTRWTVVGAVIGLVLVATLLALRDRFPSSRPGTAAPRRVAVLPFSGASTGECQSVADGVSSEVSERLASLPGIEVIAYRAASLFRGSTKPPAEIARELGVGYLLTGQVSCRGAGSGAGAVDVRVELLDVGRIKGSSPMWRRSFEAPSSDLFSLRSSLAFQVASALGVTVSTENARRLVERPAVKPEAYEMFLRGEEIFRRVGSSDRLTLEQNLDVFEKAVALDPTFADAWTRIAMICAMLYRVGVSPEAMHSRAEQATEIAERLAPDSPSIFVARSLQAQVVARNPARALDIARDGLRAWPTHPLLLNQTANLEMCLGRVEDAIGHYRQGRVLDPLFGWGLGEALVFLHRYPEALQIIEQVKVLYPLNLQFVEDEANIHLAQGDLVGARAALHDVPRDVDPTTFVVFIANEPIDYDITWALDRAQLERLLASTPGDFGGDRGQWALSLANASWVKRDAEHEHFYADEARREIEDKIRLQPDNYRFHAGLGLALAFLGRKEEAIREGERSMGMAPLTQNRYEGTIATSNLVRIYVLTGEHEKAIALLKRVMSLPQLWSSGWLGIDPAFEPLRSDPRFQMLVAGT